MSSCYCASKSKYAASGLTKNKMPTPTKPNSRLHNPQTNEWRHAGFTLHEATHTIIFLNCTVTTFKSAKAPPKTPPAERRTLRIWSLTLEESGNGWNLSLIYYKMFPEWQRTVGGCSHASTSCYREQQYGEQLRAPVQGQLAVTAFPQIFPHILCLYFQRSSSHVAPTMDKCCFCGVFHPREQLSTAPPALLCPSKCMSAVRAGEKWTLRLRDSFHYRAQTTSDITLEKYVAPEAPVCHELEKDTPVYCAYLMCVHNAFLIEIWLGYTSNHFTIPGSYMTHWCCVDVPKSRSVVTLSC